MKKSLILALSLFSSATIAEVQLSPVKLPEVGKAAQFDLSEKDELVVVNQKGELWKITTQASKLAEGLSTEVEPKARYGRIATADKNGNFLLWTENKTYSSTIPLAPKATMEALAFATIAVTKQHGQYKLVRIETSSEQAYISAEAKTPVLPDAHPLQIDFDSENSQQGHIAVLAKPDDTTYQHAVLGDDVEAAEVQFLERHSLEPLAEKLSPQGLVFEANRFATLSEKGKTKLVSVLSGEGAGAGAVLINLKNGKLAISAESNALPSNRWQSPFTFNGKLYAVQMPHLKGNLVEYQQKGKILTEQFLLSGLSNHRYGDYETNLATATDTFAIVPRMGYQQVIGIDKNGQISALATKLPAEIKQTKSTSTKAYLLLQNGEIWIAEEK